MPAITRCASYSSSEFVMEEDTKFGVLDAGRCTAMHVGARGDRPIFPHFWGMAPASAIQVSHDLSAITDPSRGLSVHRWPHSAGRARQFSAATPAAVEIASRFSLAVLPGLRVFHLFFC